MRSRIIAALVCAMCLAAATTNVAAHEFTYTRPMVLDTRLDHCLNWGRDCGQAAADKFCQMRAYAQARDWRTEPAAETYVIGARKHCRDPRPWSSDHRACLGFEAITCTSDRLTFANSNQFCIYNNLGYRQLYARVDYFHPLGSGSHIFTISKGNRQRLNLSGPAHYCVADTYGGVQLGCDGRYGPLQRCEQYTSQGQGQSGGNRPAPVTDCYWGGPGRTNCICGPQRTTDFWCAMNDAP
jgi:hypothetical protein